LSITNSICFSADKKFAYYTDTPAQIIWRQGLAKEHGWPLGDAELFIDLRQDNLKPDGAVCDAQGNLWIAQWGAARIAQYSSTGVFLQAIAVPTVHTTCPAFGAKNLNRLFITSACQGLSESERAEQPAGQTFYKDLPVTGQAEYPVILGKRD